jgi:hypothetical protein
MAEVANVVAGMCDELVAVLQKYSASLKSGNFANGNIIPPAVGAKRKRTTNTDPNKPKKAISAYIFYMMEQQPIVKKDNPDINQTEVMTRLGRICRDLHLFFGCIYKYIYIYVCIYLCM